MKEILDYYQSLPSFVEIKDSTVSTRKEVHFKGGVVIIEDCMGQIERYVPSSFDEVPETAQILAEPEIRGHRRVSDFEVDKKGFEAKMVSLVTQGKSVKDVTKYYEGTNHASSRLTVAVW